MIREKQNQLRYLVLDRCFADTRHKYTAIDLSKKVGEAIWGEPGAQVNPRLVLGDIRYMKEATAFKHLSRNSQQRTEKAGIDTAKRTIAYSITPCHLKLSIHSVLH